MSALDSLLAIASPPLGPSARSEAMTLLRPWGALGAELAGLLERHNGFYAFESALHLFGWAATAPERDLETWNGLDLWRREYRDLAEGRLFFAEDLFGCPFCLEGGKVLQFDPETAETRALATSLEEWAQKLLRDHPLLTGSPMARDWQRAHGPLRAGRRLAPKTPFVLGGTFALDNLYEADAAETMRFRGFLATQLRGLPDGAKVRLAVK